MKGMRLFLGAYLTAVILWIIIFVWQPISFWILMVGGILILVLSALLISGRDVLPRGIGGGDIFWGLVSALVLYLIFGLGYFVGSYLFAGMPEKVAEVYGLASGYSPLLLGSAMLFIIGPGEEIFWRGLLQRGLEQRYQPVGAYLITAFGYTLVHVVTGNWVLVGAAGVAGLFWGALYLWKRSLPAVMISHAFWEILIFLVFPIGGAGV